MRNVLTNDPFTYVDLWLRRQHEDQALFFWRQAGAFYQSARNLPIEAKPLLLYYSFMNAAKALLSAKHISFDPYHGVRKHNIRPPNGKTVLSNEGVRILSKGVLPSISSYYAETESSMTHSLEDMLYNLVHVHRTYCLTYPRRRDIFLPVKDPQFTRDDASGVTHFEATVATDVDWGAYRKTLPDDYQHFPRGLRRIIRSVASVSLVTGTDPTGSDLDNLRLLNRAVRSNLKYIRGSSTLWYLKMDSPTGISREPITLMLGAMHRLSELSRYHPSQLTALLNGQRNWLLNEFIAMSPSQFIDEIAAEMTGHQVLVPNVRMPV